MVGKRVTSAYKNDGFDNTDTMDWNHATLKHWLSKVLTDHEAYGAAAGRPATFEPDKDHRNASRLRKINRLSSEVITGQLTVAGHRRTAVWLMVKLKPPLAQMRTLLKVDRQFHNEIHAYQNVIPLLLENLPEGARPPALPRFVYGQNECGSHWSEDVIVLEDPRSWGYKPAVRTSPELNANFMDYDHLAVAISALGRFHGLSFTVKQKNPKAFRKLVGNLREIQWDEDGWLIKNNGLKSLGMRGARPLMEEEQYQGGKLKGFLTMIREADRNLKLAMTPNEPFAVICHGDFCKNNLLFAYDEQSGKPQDAIITEFTAIRYGSPGLDLSYFLYKCADQDVQNDRWEELLTVYLESVSVVLPVDVKAPTMDQLHHELKFHALYGYAHLLFAVPNMINEYPLDRTLLEDDKATFEDQLVARLDSSDDKITQILSATVRHIIDHGYAPLNIRSTVSQQL
ncbi:Protein of unknown function DUF227,Protein kinase-like domain,CHK kinase-like [Cinara cedri]|uniref:CHK kinase-like domain-containing protein n=1 Tax=Cinara cedri TaxID=506608 RepID=A0A5E4NH46_9HEMI|nr:Protein of unknown function DUF227,Protein kinase-like domain,CHK kinase-like [Cinara cedri]